MGADTNEGKAVGLEQALQAMPWQPLPDNPTESICDTLKSCEYETARPDGVMRQEVSCTKRYGGCLSTR
jgi:hypothetical protein